MKKITGKKYLKISFCLAASLSIGTGKGENTDNDILRNSKGEPYIPGTAIAGVVRDLLQKKYKLSDDIIKKAFGNVTINTSTEQELKIGDIKESQILFYDANIKYKPKDPSTNNNAEKNDEIKFKVSVRDSVALDEYKTAKPGAKFDMEVLEPSDSFVFETFIEFNYTEDNGLADIWKKTIALFSTGDVRFGRKTTRGLGSIENIEIQKKEFNFSSDAVDKEIIKAWLDFNIYETDKWEELADSDKPDKDENKNDSYNKDEVKLKLELRLRDGISIRRYSTEVGAADFEQLTADDKPVVPGTTWSGAFKHRIEEIITCCGKEADIISKLFFGKAGENEKDKEKSRIIFSEKTISGLENKELTRTAIDRFTGGAAEGSLYTEKTYYPKKDKDGGKTDLTITVDLSEKKNGAPQKDKTDDFLQALAAAISDLHGGYLAIGGLTSVGRGLFYVENISGHIRGENVYISVKESDSAETIYCQLQKKIKPDDNNHNGGETDA